MKIAPMTMAMSITATIAAVTATITATATAAMTMMLTACGLSCAAAVAGENALLAERDGFVTKIVTKNRGREQLEEPPAEIFSVVQYESPIGKMSAYLSKPQEDGVLVPAILWITGGFPPGGADSSAWVPVSADNDQSAKAYREAGIVMMYPTLRGSFGNPGVQEGFFGEVDDVLAAADYLSAVPYVDPQRIYIGGHSTGGTLVLLAAAASNRFRAAISFGPVADPAGYGPDSEYHDGSSKERRLRAPIHYLDEIDCPTLIIEGESGNVGSLNELRAAGKNPKLSYFAIEGADHFDVLAPVNRYLAGKIASLSKDAVLTLDDGELQAAFQVRQSVKREAEDLRTLAAVRLEGVTLDRSQPTRHYFYSRDKRTLSRLRSSAGGKGFGRAAIVEETDEYGEPYFVYVARKKVVLEDLDAVFACSKELSELASKFGVQYGGWDVGAD